MPALTLDTSSVSPTTAAPTPQDQPATTTTSQSAAQTPTNAPQSASRSLSPARPPVSPITPPLNPATLPPVPQTASTTLPPPSQQPPPQPTDFAAGRPAFSHAPIPDASATAILPPAPEPIDFEANPDVLALKSAISILQLQRQRAANDIRALSAAKSAALDSPDAFVADLTSGRIRGQNDPLFPSGDQDSSDDESDDDEEQQDPGAAGAGAPGGASEPSVTPAQPANTDAKQKPNSKGKSKTKPPSQPWTDLPRPQNVVRCPPINWSQYAVAGDSLDRLHAEQVARPSQGQPAVMGAGGTFEFRAGGGENLRELVGVAAPYTPGRDKLDKKTKGKK